ncbi:hypothetical protein ACA910_016023 [Epithemia clementina (nom. ined.)]
MVRRGARSCRALTLEGAGSSCRSALSPAAASATNDLAARWSSTSSAATSDVTPLDPTKASSKNLHLVTCALQKMLDEKAGAAISFVSEGDEKSHVVDKAWRVFENSLANAASCVNDVAENEVPEYWQAEVDTAEQAIAQAQAAFLDVLELAREMEVPLSSERGVEASRIRQLRYRLEELIEEQDRLQQKPAA